MKKYIFRLTFAVVFVSMLSACARNQFMDLSGFVYSYNRVADEKIEFQNIYSYKDESEIVFETFIDEESLDVVLKLITDKDRIKQIRIAISKIDENGTPKVPSAETVTKFVETVKSSLCAFCGFSEAEAEAVINDFGLYNLENYQKEGELTRSKDSFYFVYFSDSLVCDVMIYNTYLRKIEKTEKPESKPAFGNTTNIRTEKDD